MSLIKELPRYRCHKEVQALKIKGFVHLPNGGTEVHFSDERYCPMTLDHDWIVKHEPSVGDYIVWYGDGYVSVSPPEPFEAGYTLIETREVKLASYSVAELHARCMHPDYEYATTEGPRKCWSDEDVPPAGDGWECNVDAGRDGWERFDYHEEAYWRRRKVQEEATDEPG